MALGAFIGITGTGVAQADPGPSPRTVKPAAYVVPDYSRMPSAPSCEKRFPWSSWNCSKRDAYNAFVGSFVRPGHENLSRAVLALWGGEGARPTRTKADEALATAQYDIRGFQSLSTYGPRGYWSSPQANAYKCYRNLMAWTTYNLVVGTDEADNIAAAARKVDEIMKKSRGAVKTYYRFLAGYVKLLGNVDRAARVVMRDALTLDFINSPCG